MTPTTYQKYFLQPTDTWHRRYEALRRVFVEEQPLEEVAEHFEISYGTLCNWISEFRSQRDDHERPPFFNWRRADAPQVHKEIQNSRARKSKLRMSESCRSKRGAVSALAAPECSCSYHCWPGSGLIHSSTRRTIQEQRWCPLRARC